MANRTELAEDGKRIMFGRVARTLEYNDSDGTLFFTFDLGSHEKALELGRNAIQNNKAMRSPRIDAAFEFAKRYLESCGFDVEPYPAVAQK
jgi:hypothetical protein